MAEDDDSDLDGFDEYDPEEDVDLTEIVREADEAPVPPARDKIDISALLTPRQRDYLQGKDTEIESGSAQERTTRSRIRERLSRSLADMYIVNKGMEDRDLKQVFQQPWVWGSVNHVLEVLLTGIAAESPDFWVPRESSEGNEIEILEDRIAIAVSNHYEDQGKMITDIDVSIDIQGETTVEELVKQIQNDDATLDDMNSRQVDLLYANDYINKEEYMRIRGIFFDE